MKFVQILKSGLSFLCLVCLFSTVFLNNSFNTSSVILTITPTKYIEMSSMVNKVKKNIILLGGGPSTTPALVYLLETNINAMFYGDVVSSLLFAGRDSQKTYRGLLSIAQKYNSFSFLKEQTKDYYSYLIATSRHFNLDLSDTIDTIYPQKYKNFNNKCLFRSNTDKNKFYEVEVKDKEYFINSVKLTKNKEKIGSYVYKDDKTSESLINFGDFHKELHYLPVFFKHWQNSSLTHIEDSNVIDRAGFNYPSDLSNQLLASLNIDLARLCFNLLKKANYSDLNELEKTLKILFKKYINTHTKTVLDQRIFIIVGGGRAAGEIARRLNNDVDWKKTEEFLTQHFKEKVDERTVNELIKEYKEDVSARRKNVIVIDHKKLTKADLENETERFKKIINCESYSDFLFEICKHGVCPELSQNQKVYYKNILEKIISYEGKKDESLVERLEFLLQGQEGLVFSYRIEITDTRDENELLKLGILPKEGQIVSIGGAKHDTSWRHEGLLGDNFGMSYGLKRIKTSHYRSENLHFIEEIAKLNKESTLIEKKLNSL